jgi:drug/metabolite transporter (DMT)-like permease
MSPATRTHRIDLVATAACLGALSCWALGPIFITYLTGSLDSWTQNAVRYLVACLFWLPFLLHTMARGRFAAVTWRQALVPAVTNVVMQSLWAAGFYYLGPAFLTLLSKTSVLWVATFSLLFFPDERPLARSPRFWLGLLLSVTGVAGVLYFSGGISSQARLIGIVIGLMQAFTWGLYTISVRICVRDLDTRVSFAVISIYTMAGLWLCAGLFGQPAQILHLSVGGWGAVVVSGVTAIALGHVFYYTAIQRIGATIPMLVILAQPFFVFSMSSVLFHERLNALQLLCGAILLLGSASSIWAQQHLRAPPAGGQEVPMPDGRGTTCLDDIRTAK